MSGNYDIEFEEAVVYIVSSFSITITIMDGIYTNESVIIMMTTTRICTKCKVKFTYLVNKESDLDGKLHEPVCKGTLVTEREWEKMNRDGWQYRT